MSMVLPNSQNHSEQNQLPVWVGEGDTDAGYWEEYDATAKKFCSKNGFKILKNLDFDNRW